MSLQHLENSATTQSPLIQCGQCERQLPLRLSNSNEEAAVWMCADCNVPVVGRCDKQIFLRRTRSVYLGQRYFDISSLPPITQQQREKAISLVNRKPGQVSVDSRRSERSFRSLVVPSVELTENFNPTGPAFQAIVANLSREGIGIIHQSEIKSSYLAMLLSPTEKPNFQVIVKIIRQAALGNSFFEIGGEFHVRMGC